MTSGMKMSRKAVLMTGIPNRRPKYATIMNNIETRIAKAIKSFLCWEQNVTAEK
jgi:hypothetical protein